MVWFSLTLLATSGVFALVSERNMILTCTYQFILCSTYIKEKNHNIILRMCSNYFHDKSKVMLAPSLFKHNLDIFMYLISSKLS